MAKERDWIDYANLGSNLFQNLQLSGVQNKLGAMASAASLEQAKAEHEDRLREVVFQADTNLRGLRAHLDDEKTGVLALATFTLANFELNDVTSTSFRSFEDKERLRSVLEGFKALVEQCEPTLSAEERAEAQLCAKYMLNPDIETSVPAHLQKQLTEAEKQLQELKGKAAAALSSGFSVAAGFTILVGLLGLTMFLLGGIDEGSGGKFFEQELGVSTAEHIMRAGLILVALGGIPCCILLVADWRAKRDPLRIRQKDEIVKNQKLKIEEIQKLEQEIEEERDNIRKERSAIMAKVLKQRSDGGARRTSQPDSASSRTAFDVVLISIPAGRAQREILAIVISQINPQQTTPRFKALLKGGTALEHSLPIKILTGVSRADAVALANKLKQGGAKVEIENEQPE